MKLMITGCWPFNFSLASAFYLVLFLTLHIYAVFQTNPLLERDLHLQEFYFKQWFSTFSLDEI
jgi:hypothetical protein